MIDLSKPWPLGLGERRWWIAVAGALLLLGLALPFDRELSLYAQSWPDAVRVALAQITPYGESGWILYPSAGLWAATALLGRLVRWPPMRTMLRQFAGLYGFIFCGVGAPSLFTTIVKRIVGRGRPMHYDETGLLGLRWNFWDWTYQSFPSGHTTTAFALAASIGFLSPRWFYPGLALAAVIGVSRVSAGVHYPTDVIAGGLVGLVGAYAVRLAFASRRDVFERDAAGRIGMRPMASLRRYLSLKRRDSARGPRQDRP